MTIEGNIKLKDKNLTIVDVAEKAGVSIATVSRVLNRTGRYSQDTLRKVEAAAEAIGYAPNHVAKSLKKQRTEQVALAVADVGNPVYVAMAKAVQQVVKHYGYRLVLLSTEAQIDEEIDILKSLAKQYVDGLIISPLLYGTEHRKWIKKIKQPVVVISGSSEQIDVDSVRVDSRKGVRMALEHLIQQGYTRIGFVNGPDNTVPGASRRQGYFDTLIDHNLAVEESLVFTSDFTLSGGFKVAEQILQSGQLPDALFCANDLMALGVLRCLREHGLKVPEDMAVVGMDDIDLAAHAYPTLTTVSLMAAERGREAAELLMARLEADINKPPQLVNVSPRLIVRESSVLRE